MNSLYMMLGSIEVNVIMMSKIIYKSVKKRGRKMIYLRQPAVFQTKLNREQSHCSIIQFEGFYVIFKLYFLKFSIFFLKEIYALHKMITFPFNDVIFSGFDKEAKLMIRFLLIINAFINFLLASI